ncbi:MAG: hypothetical protein K5866_10000 [Treponema sp.]|nr:hypothetical protein [Treponema sp.]
MKKILTILAGISLLALVSCASNKVEEEVVPEVSAAKAAAMAEEGAIDLGTYESVDSWAMTYDEDAYTLTMNGGEYFQFRLPTPLEAGQSVTVHITGTNTGTTGFRGWLVDDNQTTNADPLYLDSAFDGLPAGDFDITYTLNATNTSTYVFFKGPQWGTMIEGFTLKSLSVIYN